MTTYKYEDKIFKTKVAARADVLARDRREKARLSSDMTFYQWMFILGLASAAAWAVFILIAH